MNRVKCIAHSMVTLISVLSFEPIRSEVSRFVRQSVRPLALLQNSQHRIHHVTIAVASHSWNPQMIFQQRHIDPYFLQRMNRSSSWKMLDKTKPTLYQQLIILPQLQRHLIPIEIMNSYSFLIVKITVLHLLPQQRYVRQSDIPHADVMNMANHPGWRTGTKLICHH